MTFIPKWTVGHSSRTRTRPGTVIAGRPQRGGRNSPTIGSVRPSLCPRAETVAELEVPILLKDDPYVTEQTERIGQQKDQAKTLGRAWESTIDEVDHAQQALDTAAETGTEVSREHRTYLAALFDGDPDNTDPAAALAEFDAAMKRATERLHADRQAAAESIGRAQKALHDTFSTFLERWPNPNLGTDPDASYRDFDRLLTDLETSGLHELEIEWRDSLLKLSGNDLTSLDSELAAAVREIRDRIDPVNRILAELPFADDAHRLRIDPQESHSAVRARFRKELRDVRAIIDNAATDTDGERAAPNT